MMAVVSQLAPSYDVNMPCCCMEQEVHEEQDNSFADYLPWYDIIFKHILPRLDLPSLLNLHAVNSSYKLLVEEYHQRAQSFNVNDAKMTPHQFAELTSQMTSLSACALGPNPWLTDKLAASLFGRNHDLIWISLRECPLVGNSTVLKIANSCPNLRGLNLTECHWLTLDTIRYLVRKCPKIQSLDLTRCSRVDDRAVACIGCGLKSLGSLCLAGAFNVTDRAVASASFLPRLKHINVQYTNITDNSLRLMAKHMKQLTHVDLYGCRKVTSGAISRLAATLNAQLDVKVKGYK